MSKPLKPAALFILGGSMCIISFLAGSFNERVNKGTYTQGDYGKDCMGTFLNGEYQIHKEMDSYSIFDKNDRLVIEFITDYRRVGDKFIAVSPDRTLVFAADGTYVEVYNRTRP